MLKPRYLMTSVKAAVVQAHKRKFRRQRRVPAQAVARGPERSYKIQLNNLITRIRNQIVRELLPVLASVDAQRADEMVVRLDQWPAYIAAAVERLKLGMLKDLTGVPLVTEIARATTAVNDNSWIAISRAVLGVDLLGAEAWKPELLEAFTETNVGLITNLVDDTYAKIQSTVLDDFRAGKRHEQIAKELLSNGTDLPPGPFERARTRAELIARDQVSKLNGQLTQARNTELGIEEYIWLTVQDQRVREEHAERQGETFRWDDPPEGGHPGEAINCRCTSRPVIKAYEDILAEEESTEEAE